MLDDVDYKDKIFKFVKDPKNAKLMYDASIKLWNAEFNVKTAKFNKSEFKDVIKILEKLIRNE